jgi:hypothetical protein
MSTLHSSNGTVKPRPTTAPRKPRTRKPAVERPRPMLVNGVGFATLSIPDPKGKGPNKVYRVYPYRDLRGCVISGRVRLWYRGEDGQGITYHVVRGSLVTCSCPGYTTHGDCKHARACIELGIV